ncbi:RnfABCDGE type electron transport complex subunit D [Sinanaerobacter sp. ZZT-01]|uniref:RnfABCDGE type electron transport complex subunit D n=1 Tax=Sinanaerobacter sp. ZZT-01 TaxID=3111540 RepID=UPI002D771EBB|nr:RnfABCDGE type electron transport complex subunit D [Sinanaerobacter sp. ZZT-01]WRR94436.1 RnfABCDGE type electron transport complex subunit D [Sinanaerobacter sp. ZZT-01]
MSKMKNGNLIVSSAPHVVSPVNTSNIMRDVCIALIPAMIMEVVVFGLRALALTAVCVAACILFESITRRLLGRPDTISDLSAVVTGILLSYNLPAGLPFWMAIIGCFVAIVIVKQVFGGLGQNFANPAIVGRIVLFISFATPMTTWVLPKSQQTVDAITGATPLGLFSKGMDVPSNMDMFLGFIGGCTGEVSALALLLGGVYLVFKKVIEPTIPVSFIATVFVFALVTGLDPVFHIFAGGVMLGAIFMATDYVTSPITTRGKIIFGIGCGLLTMLIRLYSSYPEGVSFAILLMNILTPHIDNLTRLKLNGVPAGGDK